MDDSFTNGTTCSAGLILDKYTNTIFYIRRVLRGFNPQNGRKTHRIYQYHADFGASCLQLQYLIHCKNYINAQPFISIILSARNKLLIWYHNHFWYPYQVRNMLKFYSPWTSQVPILFSCDLFWGQKRFACFRSCNMNIKQTKFYIDYSKVFRLEE